MCVSFLFHAPIHLWERARCRNLLPNHSTSKCMTSKRWKSNTKYISCCSYPEFRLLVPDICFISSLISILSFLLLSHSLSIPNVYVFLYFIPAPSSNEICLPTFTLVIFSSPWHPVLLGYVRHVWEPNMFHITEMVSRSGVMSLPANILSSEQIELRRAMRLALRLRYSTASIE